MRAETRGLCVLCPLSLLDVNQKWKVSTDSSETSRTFVSRFWSLIMWTYTTDRQIDEGGDAKSHFSQLLVANTLDTLIPRSV